jgi:hypothetical protein
LPFGPCEFDVRVVDITPTRQFPRLRRGRTHSQPIPELAGEAILSLSNALLIRLRCCWVMPAKAMPAP